VLFRVFVQNTGIDIFKAPFLTREGSVLKSMWDNGNTWLA